MKRIIFLLSVLTLMLFLEPFLVLVKAHDIYTGLVDKRQQLCCGGNDCALTSYREQAGEFQILTREKHWVSIPEERITFLPIPGDPPHNDTHAAHLCYREFSDANSFDAVSGNLFSGEGQTIFLYCAFIPPGGV